MIVSSFEVLVYLILRQQILLELSARWRLKGPCISVSAVAMITCVADNHLVTGIFLAQAAISILRDEHETLHGGVYTPACLGEKFVDRLGTAGLKVEQKFYED